MREVQLDVVACDSAEARRSASPMTVIERDPFACDSSSSSSGRHLALARLLALVLLLARLLLSLYLLYDCR